MGTLYVVPTPVGNMEDMTLRAIRVLKEADLILAEDTRTSSVLLKHYGIRNQLMSHHKFNERRNTRHQRPGVLPHSRGRGCRRRGSVPSGGYGVRSGHRFERSARRPFLL